MNGFDNAILFPVVLKASICLICLGLVCFQWYSDTKLGGKL